MLGAVKPAEAGSETFVAEDSFLIRGRGWVLAPALAMDCFPANAMLALDVVGPSGAGRVLCGRFMVEHLRSSDGTSRWDGVIVLDENTDHVVPGSRVTCRLASS